MLCIHAVPDLLEFYDTCIVNIWFHLRARGRVCVCTCAFRQNTYPGQRLLLVERLLRLQGAVLVTVGQKGTSWGKEEKPIYDMKLGPTVIHKISLLQTLLSIALPFLFFVCSNNRPCKLQIYIHLYLEQRHYSTHYLCRLLQC